MPSGRQSKAKRRTDAQAAKAAAATASLDDLGKAGYELKIKRALYHLHVLDHHAKRWLERDAYTLIEEDEPHTGGKVMTVRPLKPPMPGLALLFGDCVHNLRSALDLLAHDLAWRGARGPITEWTDRGSAFPVWRTTPREGEVRKRIGTIDPAAQTIIKGLQPRDAQDRFVPNDLWLLDELWNFDKHRRLQLTLFAVVAFGLGSQGPQFSVEWFEPLGGGPIRRETPLFRYKVEPAPGTTVDMKRTPRFAVTLGQGTPAQGEPIVPLLRRLHDYVVTDVVEPLAPFLK